MKTFKEKVLALNPEKIIEIDGIKAYFKGPSAILARSSNTESIIVARVESYNEETFNQLSNFLKEMVDY